MTKSLMPRYVDGLLYIYNNERFRIGVGNFQIKYISVTKYVTCQLGQSMVLHDIMRIQKGTHGYQLVSLG